VQNRRDIRTLEDQRVAAINEGEANSSPPGQVARYFHYREESRKIARASELQVNWPVTEARGQDFGPSRSVKDSRIRVRADQIVPFAIAKRINDFRF